MYLEIPLDGYQQSRLEEIAKKVKRCSNEFFWIPALRDKIKNSLIKNKKMYINPYWGDIYYEALFAALLVTKNPSVIKVETIIKAIRPRDSECFFFFVKDILAEKNPPCIEDSPTKQLMLAIVKKRA